MLPPHLQSLYTPGNLLYHPETENDVAGFIQYAVEHKLQIRVRGASQSEKPSIYTDNYDPVNNQAGPNLNLELDQIRDITFDDANLQVTAGAGCNLGYDPFDPSMTSKDVPNSNGLLPLVAAHGWVIPNVPTVIHQTVGGLLATGSSGGSLTYSFDELIVAIRLVDGTGTIKTYTRTGNLNDPFYAIGTSMGLLGIVVAVTIQCMPYYNNNQYQSTNIVGHQTITAEADCAFDFLGTGSGQKPSLGEFLQKNTYTRLMWWPYKELNWVVSWYAEPMSKADEPFVQQGAQPFSPPFPVIFPGLPNWRLPGQVIASIAYWLINNWPDWFDSLTANYADESQKEKWALAKSFIQVSFPSFYPALVSRFFSPTNPPQHFWAIWWQALAMDSFEFSTNLFDLNYTELWVNIDQTQALIDVLDKHYKQGGISATGTYTVEVCGAKQSDFWLSPANGHNVVRINILYFANGIEKPESYFGQFWDLLYQNKINFRPHWGKMLPPANDPHTGAAYIAAQYSKWVDFMSLRSIMDPHAIFLTSYWKTQLGIDLTSHS